MIPKENKTNLQGHILYYILACCKSRTFLVFITQTLNAYRLQINDSWPTLLIIKLLIPETVCILKKKNKQIVIGRF